MILNTLIFYSFLHKVKLCTFLFCWINFYSYFSFWCRINSYFSTRSRIYSYFSHCIVWLLQVNSILLSYHKILSTVVIFVQSINNSIIFKHISSFKNIGSECSLIFSVIILLLYQVFYLHIFLQIQVIMLKSLIILQNRQLHFPVLSKLLKLLIRICRLKLKFI